MLYVYQSEILRLRRLCCPITLFKGGGRGWRKGGGQRKGIANRGRGACGENGGGGGDAGGGRVGWTISGKHY